MVLYLSVLPEQLPENGGPEVTPGVPWRTAAPAIWAMDKYEHQFSFPCCPVCS